VRYTVIYVLLHNIFIYTKNRRIECLIAEKTIRITINHNNVFYYIMSIIVVFARPTQRNPFVAAQILAGLMLHATIIFFRF